MIPLSLYIHIPWCIRKCPYCDFNSHKAPETLPEVDYIDALLADFKQEYQHARQRPISSIFIGGGTPSLFTADSIDRLLNDIQQTAELIPNAEITLEANPDDITHLKITRLKTGGINRLSVGIQSFIDHELIVSNRAHTAEESENAIKICQDAGMDNLSLDLIYGMPNSNQETWQYNIDKALQLDVQHISSYALTVEPNTALDLMVKKETIQLPTEIEVSQQYLNLITSLTTHNYDHYEISNFAKPNKYAIHNTNYWRSIPYLGLGPSAHSYQPTFRQWNVNNNAKYIESITNGIVPFEIEKTNHTDQFNEYIMTRLRTMWGINIEELKNRFPNQLQSVHDGISEYIQSDHAILQNNHYKLTPEGRLLADRIASNLFLVGNE